MSIAKVTLNGETRYKYSCLECGAVKYFDDTPIFPLEEPICDCAGDYVDPEDRVESATDEEIDFPLIEPEDTNDD